MERGTVTVLGLGFRADADVQSLRDAVRAANAMVPGSHTVTALATAQDKVALPALKQFAAELGLPVIGVPLALLAGQPAAFSAHAPTRYGGRSLAEAAALAVAGPQGRLLASRAVSSDGKATAALAALVKNTTEGWSP
jgi:cobalt-precorrin 5A hydrolase